VSKRGLPSSFKLRHDLHYVEQLTGKPAGAPVGIMVAIDKLAPNPNQPRTDVGDLAELVQSIQEKGVLEPLLVRPSDVGGRYMIIAGERRYRASLEVGLPEVPCIELNVDDRAVAEISLIENLQRKDLTPFEEADGLQALAERFGCTHEDIARRIGKSRSSITETISLAGMPAEVREECRRADIRAKSTLLEIVRQPSVEEMIGLAQKINRVGLTRDEARQERKGTVAKPRMSAFQYESDDRGFSVVVKFKKTSPAQADIESALREALGSLTKNTS
jgi:ParB family chromosome partitioning protein